MTTLNRLILPETYEDLTSELGGELEKMVQFVVPVEEAKRQLAVITQTVKHSGKNQQEFSYSSTRNFRAKTERDFSGEVPSLVKQHQAGHHR